MNPEQLKEMNEIKWWHQIELDGVMTNGIDFSKVKLNAIQNKTMSWGEEGKNRSLTDIASILPLIRCWSEMGRGLHELCTEITWENPSVSIEKVSHHEPQYCIFNRRDSMTGNQEPNVIKLKITTTDGINYPRNFIAKEFYYMSQRKEFAYNFSCFLTDEQERDMTVYEKAREKPRKLTLDDTNENLRDVKIARQLAHR